MELKNSKNARRQTTMQMYWLSFVILQLLLLVTQTQLTHASDVIRVGGLFESSDSHLRVAFRRAVDAVNKDRTVMSNTELAPKIANIPSNNSFKASRKVCSITKSGVGAVFGPQSSKTSDQVEAICEALQIPHIKTMMDYSSTGDEYSVNFYPHPSTLGRAYSEVLKSLGWKKLCIIYGDNNGLIRVQELMKDAHFDITFKQLPSSDDYRSIFKEAREDGVRHIVLDVSRENLFTALKQAQQVGMLTDYHNYFITSLDLHTIDLEEFKHGGASIFSLQLFNPQDPQMQTEVALMYDAVQVFAKAVDNLGRSVSIDITPLDCDGDAIWANGAALIDYMRMVEINGMTGLVKFDAVDGFRSDVTLTVVQLAKDGLNRIGSWDQTSGGNLAGSDEFIEDAIEENLQDKTLTVSIALSDPYVMLKVNAEQLSGNDRYEGFCIDLLQRISEHLGFNFRLVEPNDKRYGSIDPQTNNWTGLIGDVVNLRADLAITDLTINTPREEAVDFSIPWMNTGISILYVKPVPQGPRWFSFMYPFSIEVWVYLLLTYLAVSLILFALARLSPCENVSELSTLEDNHNKIGNSFTWDNSLWFTIGSLLQQRTYQQPRAASTRIVAFMWWMFVFIMFCCYIAGLISMFNDIHVGYFDSPIETVEDLPGQSRIKYGTLNGGATHNFFETSSLPTYRKMNLELENVNSAKEGVERVEQYDGDYAFLMESTSIEYIEQRRCNLMKVGRLLDSKSYGIAFPKGSPYRKLVNTAIIKLKEDGILRRLKSKWWEQMRGGGKCKIGEDYSYKGPHQLSPQHVTGVFIILLIGLAIAVVVGAAEFLWDFIKKRKNQE